MGTEKNTIEFFKFHGCGNDFVFIDNRQVGVPIEEMSLWAKKICSRIFGIGADGLAFLDVASNEEADYMWCFYNADGSRAEMCGNATRCAGALAVEIGLADYAHTLQTDAGLVNIFVEKDCKSATVTMMDPKDCVLGFPLLVNGDSLTVHSVNTGVPHAIVFTENLSTYDVHGQGCIVRNHEYFGTKGTNVNFVSIESPDTIKIRTYERGVEGETLACGTGACAAVVIGNELGVMESSVCVKTESGENLTIMLKDGHVLMKGPATKTFAGLLYMDAIGLC